MSRHEDWPNALSLDPTAFIAPGAIVVGEVTLGARASVWFHSVLRGDSAGITIGSDSNIQDLTTVHVDDGFPAVVGARVTVGHRAIIHGCVIEDDCLIGMGAVILTGARIGTGSLIGASALVKEHQVIPPGSLAVGAPARVIGPVTDAHREAIRVGAIHYAQLRASYLQRGIGSAFPPHASRQAFHPRTNERMDFLEWEQRLEVLRTSPAWAQAQYEKAGTEAFRRVPGPQRWSATAIVCHLRDCDREVFAPRLEAVLTQDFPALPDVPAQVWAEARGYAHAETQAALTQWRIAREALVRTLEPLTPVHWARPLTHSYRGPHTLADVVRYWSDHDLSHRRQLREALGMFA